MSSTKQKLNRITVDPEICLGQPTIRGMRITVSVILKQIASGMPKEEILKAYPELEEEDIIQALTFSFQRVFNHVQARLEYGCDVFWVR